MSEETLSDKERKIDSEASGWDDDIKDKSVIPTEDVKQFTKELKEVAEENDWEVAVDNGYPDGFQVISGVEFINKKAGDKLIE